ncbi:MAG TPA: hypothetical protein PLE09_04705, partial [Caldisericia bacterium]|nr:hypothetical protein [Caldisericia bacterium]
MKLIRMIVAVVLFLSMMQIPYNALFAEENNYALAYFQHPQEIDTYKQYQPNILEIYSDHVLCKLSKPLEDYLQTNDIFYQTIGDITRFHFDQYEFSSNSQKDVLYPAKFTEELSKLSFAEPAIYLLQFIGPVKTSWIELLKSYNIELYMQLDNYAYLTKGRGIDMHNLKTLSFIRSTGLFPPSLKIPEIALSMDQEELINIDVNVSNDFDIEIFQKYFRHSSEQTLHTAFSGRQYLRLIDV